VARQQHGARPRRHPVRSGGDVTAMTTYHFDIDLVGSTATEAIEAPDDEAAVLLVALMHPGARSISLTGAVPVRVDAR
jgi:hypothetical protein